MRPRRARGRRREREEQSLAVGGGRRQQHCRWRGPYAVYAPQPHRAFPAQYVLSHPSRALSLSTDTTATVRFPHARLRCARRKRRELWRCPVQGVFSRAAKTTRLPRGASLAHARAARRPPATRKPAAVRPRQAHCARPAVSHRVPFASRRRTWCKKPRTAVATHTPDGPRPAHWRPRERAARLPPRPRPRSRLSRQTKPLFPHQSAAGWLRRLLLPSPAYPRPPPGFFDSPRVSAPPLYPAHEALHGRKVALAAPALLRLCLPNGLA